MLRYLRFKLLILVVAVYLLFKFVIKPQLNIAEFNKFLPGEVVPEMWQPLGDPSLRYKIYSAYFDYRIEVFKNYTPPDDKVLLGGVRVITILYLKMDKTKIFCNFRYKSGEWKKLKPMHVVFMNDYMWTRYIATFVICPITRNSDERNIEFPEIVGITYDLEESMKEVTSVVRIKYPSHINDLANPPIQNNEIVVCATPAYNFKDSLRLVEYVEFWKELGATKFYFYNKTIGQSVDQVIRYYEEQGDMTIMDWAIEGYKHKIELRTEASFAAFHDCLYRAFVVDNLKYMVMADYDEFLLPQDGSRDLFHFMEKRDNGTINSFNFRMAYLLDGLPEKYSSVPLDARNPYLYTQKRIGRVSNTSYYLDHHIRSKYITKTAYSVELGNHYLFKAVEGTQEYKVDLNEGMSYHYRDFWGYPFCTAENTVHDYTARLYGRNLWDAVDKVCGNVFKSGICSLGRAE